MDYLSALLPNLLPQIPHLILNAAGLWLAITRRKQYPRIYLAAGVYFGLALFVRIVSQIYVVLPLYFQDQGYSTVNISSIFITLNIICIPFTVIMDLALLYAIFSPRSQPDSDDPNKPIFVGDNHA